MIERDIKPTLLETLDHRPAVALLGPRQSGKTTLAREIQAIRGASYFDLESESDRNKLADPEFFLPTLVDRLVILDEIHRTPALFPVLRGLIDRARLDGRRSNLYLLLGSASLDLLRQSGESLAGRISYLEMGPFNALEASRESLQTLWLRGGFPDSLLAGDGPWSLRWRQDFIRTYLERDVPLFHPRMGGDPMRRYWTMLAHGQGGLHNTALMARNLGIDQRTAARYLDLLEDLLLVRRLPPWHANVGKRLVKTSKVYVRDSGLVHALLGIPDLETLLSHPVVGASWEGFVLENLASAAPAGVRPYFYRTTGGAEVDLVLEWPGGKLWAVEIKLSLSPKVERGFHEALSDLGPEKALVVYPGADPLPMRGGIQALGLRAAMELLREAGGGPAV
jgi:predicted AAA+ superfamily ATPase